MLAPRWRFGCRAIFIASLQLAAIAVKGDPGGVFDPSEGHINGQKAVSFWVVQGIGSRDLIDPSEFVVQLVPAKDLDTVHTWPAGEWFVPAPGKYKFWIEGPGLMMPYTAVFNFRLQPFMDKGSAAVVPVEPAGTVVLSDKVVVGPSTVWRLLHLESHNRAPFPQRELSRSVRLGLTAPEAQMPDGQVVTALVDSETEEYLALSRPVAVKHNGRVTVAPTAPRPPDSDLLVRLERPGFVNDHAQYDVDVVAKNRDGASLKPDVLVPTTDRLYAIWFALAESRISLEVQSTSVYLPTETIVLRPGKVESFRGALLRRPNVNVRFELPTSLRDGRELRLEVVLDRPGHKSLQEIELPAEVDSFLLEKLGVAPIEILLHANPWTFRRSADLSDGLDAEVIFDPTPITVAGTVYRGDQGHPATIEFERPRDRAPLAVRTDEAGSYEAQLFATGLYVVNVRLDGFEGIAHYELLDRPLHDDATLDFLIPDNRFTVRVIDVEANVGIESAEVAVGNRYESMGGSLRTPDTKKQAVLRVQTDGEGKVELRPLHPGTVTLRANAEGYLPSDMIEERIEEGEEGREITIEMRAVEDGTRLRLLWPDGRSAAGTEVRIQTSLGSTQPLWSGSADVEGYVEIPSTSSQAFVLARHAAGGYLVRSLSASTSDTWTLIPAKTSLAVELQRPWGSPARWASIALWIEERCIFGQSLAWLAGAPIAADGEGYWRGKNLPATTLKILAWSQDQAVDPLALETLARELSYPWQNMVTLSTLN